MIVVFLGTISRIMSSVVFSSSYPHTHTFWTFPYKVLILYDDLLNSLHLSILWLTDVSLHFNDLHQSPLAPRTWTITQIKVALFKTVKLFSCCTFSNSSILSTYGAYISSHLYYFCFSLNRRVYQKYLFFSTWYSSVVYKLHFYNLLYNSTSTTIQFQKTNSKHLLATLVLPGNKQMLSAFSSI